MFLKTVTFGIWFVNIVTANVCLEALRGQKDVSNGIRFGISLLIINLIILFIRWPEKTTWSIIKAKLAAKPKSTVSSSQRPAQKENRLVTALTHASTDAAKRVIEGLDSPSQDFWLLPDPTGLNPIEAAAIHGDVEIFKLIYKKTPSKAIDKLKLQQLAYAYSHEELSEYLEKHHASASFKKVDATTSPHDKLVDLPSMWFALVDDQLEVLKSLYQRGADLAVPLNPKYGAWANYGKIHASHVVAVFGSVQTLKWLLTERKSLANIRSSKGNYTPLHLAVLRGDLHLVETAIELGCKILDEADGRLSAHEMAEKAGHPAEFIAAIRKLEADQHAQDKIEKEAIDRKNREIEAQQKAERIAAEAKAPADRAAAAAPAPAPKAPAAPLNPFKLLLMRSLNHLPRWEPLSKVLAVDFYSWFSQTAPNPRAILIDGSTGTGKTMAAMSMSGELAGRGVDWIKLSPGKVVRFTSAQFTTLAQKVSELPARSIVLVDEINLALDPASKFFDAGTRAQFISSLQHLFDRNAHMWVFLGDFASIRGDKRLTQPQVNQLFGPTLGAHIDFMNYQVPEWQIHTLVEAISLHLGGDSGPFETAGLFKLAEHCIASGGAFRECEKHLRSLITQRTTQGVGDKISEETVQSYLAKLMGNAA